MHIQHEIFIQAVQKKKKIITTYLSGENDLYTTGLFVPLKYTPSIPEGGSGYYCFWDLDAKVDDRLLILSSYLIESMEISEEFYDPDNYIISKKE